MFLEGFSPSWMALMMILNFICANCVYQKNYFEISNHIYCFAVPRTLQTELFPSIPNLSLRYILCCLELLKPYSLLQLDGQMPSDESREAYSYKSILILFTFDVGLIRGVTYSLVEALALALVLFSLNVYRLTMERNQSWGSLSTRRHRSSPWWSTPTTVFYLHILCWSTLMWFRG
ncbi:unnamed protein product [Musa acuminata subsp. burmannicoides]